MIFFFDVINSILKDFEGLTTFIVEQCCTENGVPDNCLGLCVEEQKADLDRRAAFLSICDKFQDIVERCTIGPKGKLHINQIGNNNIQK